MIHYVFSEKPVLQTKLLFGILTGGEIIFMTKRKGIGMPAAILGLGILVVVGGLAYTGNLSAIGGDGDQQLDDDLEAAASFKVSDKHADSTSYLTVDYKVYDANGLQVASGQSNGSDFAKIADLDENSDYTMYLTDDDGADSDDIYTAKKEFTTGEGTSRFVVEAERQGSIKTSVEEDSGAQDDDGTIAVNQGKTETVTLSIEENSGDAVVNQPAVFYKTNDSSVIEEVTVDGTEISEDVDRLSSYDDGFDTGISKLVDFEESEVTVKITRADGATGDATVTLATVDGDEFQNDQDSFEFGYEDSDDNDIRLGDNTDTVTVTTP